MLYMTGKQYPVIDESVVRSSGENHRSPSLGESDMN